MKVEDIMLSGIRHKKKTTTVSHLYVEYIKIKLLEAMSITRGQRMGKMWRCWLKDTVFQLCRVD